MPDDHESDRPTSASAGSSSRIATHGPPCPCPLAPAADDDHTLRVSAPATPATVQNLRRALRDWLDARGVEREDAEDVVLLVDEAVTNAVEHACTDHDSCRVEVIATGRPCGAGIAVLIGDDGHWRPRPADPGHRGRGVELMGRLADRSSILTGRHGTTVQMCWLPATRPTT